MRQFLVAGSLALLVGGTPAPAQGIDENLVVVDQAGADNRADITQSGFGNVAGLEALPILQDGFWNDLSIVQENANNRIATEGAGLLQEGRFTTRSIHNAISIEQRSNANVVGEVRQLSLGVVPNGANMLGIVQRGGDENRIDAVSQVQLGGQAPQQMELQQTGAGNRIVRAAQTSLTTDRTEANVIRVTLAGDRNGQGALLGVAALPALASSTLVQEGGSIDMRGNGNFAELIVTGDDTAFGIRQGGRLNSVGAVVVTGDLNAIGLRQDGDENDIVLAPVDGDLNEIGIDQIGTNYAEVTLLDRASGNAVALRQQGGADGFVFVEGNDNRIAVEQDFLGGLGGDNTTSVQVTGAGNALEVQQAGRNRADVTVTGDANNSVGAFTAPGMPALAVGLVKQDGFDNVVQIGLTGNRNAVAAMQTGSLNLFDLVVTGDDNEALLLQSGSGNTARVGQTGIGNRASISQ
ncbi:hypothetical protein [Roseivivax isoporae]|uniref:Curlin n=1 Tax=Roseivivax isoporae LMG 25204 TaxID=1449351 RepID=X7F1H8_9RHOB|nr:hypothetical protein [Roseivivax isoporae]ETX26583.1 hypothetical protein RISW2_21905 [Roseivivax isoporae LMG 25204]